MGAWWADRVGGSPERLAEVTANGPVTDSSSRVAGWTVWLRHHNDQARASASVAETKAHRQVQISLSVLTLAFVVGGIQLGLVANEHWTWLFTLVPAVYALVCLIISAFEALQVDRVGFYHHPSGQSIATLGAGDWVTRLLTEEEKGRQLAQWTSRKKAHRPHAGPRMVYPWTGGSDPGHSYHVGRFAANGQRSHVCEADAV